MSFHLTIAVKRRLCVAVLTVLSLGGGMAVLAQTDSAPIAEPALSITDLNQAKSDYQSAWESVARAQQRRDELQHNLDTVTANVSKAREQLQRVSQERLDLRRKIAAQRLFVQAVQTQMRSLTVSQEQYHVLRDQQKDELITFVRYMADRQMEVTDTGPVFGGSVVRRMLRGSLGDIIAQDLNHEALLLARQRFLTELSGFLSETDKAQQRLATVKAGLEEQIKTFTAQYQDLDVAQTQTQAIVDAGWRDQQLTQEQLTEVLSETTEVDAQLAGMQQNLVAINLQLKAQQETTLTRAIADLTGQRTKAQATLADLRDSEAHLQAADDARASAYVAAMQQRNTDKNLYKRVADLQLKLSNTQSAYQDTIASALAATQDPVQVAALQTQGDAMQAQIAHLTSELALMQEGVPEDAADAYVRANALADVADAKRVALQGQIADASAIVADLSGRISDAQHALDQARSLSAEIDNLPPLFHWPVFGSITAGYEDPDYLRVFGVPHHAIDISTAQGSPVHAVADGIVYKVHDGGETRYSYILIGHRSGYASLYGHVSRFLAKEGDIVFGGQVIALSGGTPGTHGAGPMTTGPHVHLEMTLNGVHFDPRTILPKR